MVAQTRLNVTLYVRCLSVYFLHIFRAGTGTRPVSYPVRIWVSVPVAKYRPNVNAIIDV